MGYMRGLIIMKFWYLDKAFGGILADLEKAPGRIKRR